MKVKAVSLSPFDRRMARIGNHLWSVARLATLTASIPVMEIPLAHLNMYNTLGPLTLREMVGHMQAVLDADTSYPIILDEDGEIMDGRHRVMHALLNGHETVRAVRFDVNPTPCRVVDETENSTA